MFGPINLSKESKFNKLYLNIINIPSCVETVPTKITFLSHTPIRTFNDLLEVLNFYGSLNQPITITSGEYVTGTGLADHERYSLNDLYIYPNGVHLTYKSSINKITDVILAEISQPPSDWSYYNIEL